MTDQKTTKATKAKVTKAAKAAEAEAMNRWGLVQDADRMVLDADGKATSARLVLADMLHEFVSLTESHGVINMTDAVIVERLDTIADVTTFKSYIKAGWARHCALQAGLDANTIPTIDAGRILMGNLKNAEGGKLTRIQHLRELDNQQHATDRVRLFADRMASMDERGVQAEDIARECVQMMPGFDKPELTEAEAEAATDAKGEKSEKTDAQRLAEAEARYIKALSKVNAKARKASLAKVNAAEFKS